MSMVNFETYVTISSEVKVELTNLKALFKNILCTQIDIFHYLVVSKIGWVLV